jgi:4'-phosphopantetheinyl transferase
MNTIEIQYTLFKKPLPDKVYSHYLNHMPALLQEKNLQFLKWQDRHLNLFGKLLLCKGLKAYGYDKDVLENLKYNKYGRPFLNKNIDFNISHSGEYVVCIIGKNLKLGIDIEEIKEIEFKDYKMVMTDQQWEDIYQSSNPTKSFFNFWTMKESMIKADRRGLSIPLLDIHIKNNIIQYSNRTWYLKEFVIDENYCSYIATNKQDLEVKLNKIDFENNFFSLL